MMNYKCQTCNGQLKSYPYQAGVFCPACDDKFNKRNNLCDSCIHGDTGGCEAAEVEFGNGPGNDNVVKCDEYQDKSICPCCEEPTKTKELFCGSYMCSVCGELL